MHSESLAQDDDDLYTLGSSILLTTRKLAPQKSQTRWLELCEVVGHVGIVVTADQARDIAEVKAHPRFHQAKVEVDILARLQVLRKTAVPLQQVAPVQARADQPARMMALDSRFRRSPRAGFEASRNAPVNCIEIGIPLE